MNERWEVGSEFDWSNDAIAPAGSVSLLPETYELFSTGRSILLSIQRLLNGDQGRLRLHLPSFFCMDVAADLKTVFDLCWYRDLPIEQAPDFNSLRPLPGDLVLAVNFFGVREGKVWQDWLCQHDDIILIEDHTHDPFSPWAQQSTAHYAMASLRKTLPIPDGAIIWSPQKMKLPQPSSSVSSGAYQKLAAMLLKRAYLSGANISKDAYRLLQVQGEQCLSAETNSTALSFTYNILSCLNISELRQQREVNIQHFLQLTLAEPHTSWMPIFTAWPPGAVPFNSILVCKNTEIRDELRKFLITQNIFAAIHWQQPLKELSANDSVAMDLSNRILTIPTDHRYSFNDITRIVEKVANYFKYERNKL